MEMHQRSFIQIRSKKIWKKVAIKKTGELIRANSFDRLL